MTLPLALSNLSNASDPSIPFLRDEFDLAVDQETICALDKDADKWDAEVVFKRLRLAVGAPVHFCRTWTHDPGDVPGRSMG